MAERNIPKEVQAAWDDYSADCGDTPGAQLRELSIHTAWALDPPQDGTLEENAFALLLEGTQLDDGPAKDDVGQPVSALFDRRQLRIPPDRPRWPRQVFHLFGGVDGEQGHGGPASPKDEQIRVLCLYQRAETIKPDPKGKLASTVVFPTHLLPFEYIRYLLLPFNPEGRYVADADTDGLHDAYHALLPFATTDGNGRQREEFEVHTVFGLWSGDIVLMRATLEEKTGGEEEQTVELFLWFIKDERWRCNLEYVESVRHLDGTRRLGGPNDNKVRMGCLPDACVDLVPDPSRPGDRQRHMFLVNAATPKPRVLSHLERFRQPLALTK